MPSDFEKGMSILGIIGQRSVVEYLVDSPKCRDNEQRSVLRYLAIQGQSDVLIGAIVFGNECSVQLRLCRKQKASSSSVDIK